MGRNPLRQCPIRHRNRPTTRYPNPSRNQADAPRHSAADCRVATSPGWAITHLTFSQRNDLAPIPQPLKLGEISDKFRKDLWDAFYSIIIEDTGDPNLQDEYNELIISMLKQTENIFFGKTLDEIVNETVYIIIQINTKNSS